MTGKNGELTLSGVISKNGRMNSFVNTPLLSKIALLIGAHLFCIPAFSQERTNYFNDPFVQATSGLVDCPVPEGPAVSSDEAKSESHYRTERGTSCYQSGRCRLPNSYLYDKEIIPRVKQFIFSEGRYSNTSIWVTGQRRWVILKGCVSSNFQAKELERSIKRVDDVEAVINELKVLRNSTSHSLVRRESNR